MRIRWRLIDSTYDVLEQQSDAQTIEKSKKMLGQMESVLGADSTIESLCDDIVEHYEKYRANLSDRKSNDCGVFSSDCNENISPYFKNST